MNRITAPDGTIPQPQIPEPPKDKLLWRVMITDRLFMPQQRAMAVVNDAQNIPEAMDSCMSGDTYRTFKGMFPNAVIVGCEFFGVLE